jgi:uncharacterized membrane protein
MEPIKLLTWISIYVVLATILLNMLRYGIRLNLPNSLVLSASVSFLLFRISISKSFGYFFSEYIYFFIVLGVITAVIVVTAMSGKDTHGSMNNINNQQKTWTMIFRIGKR